MASTRQEAQRQALLEITRSHTARVRGLAGLSPEQLKWQPPDGGWSVAHVLEHLHLVNHSYLPTIARLTAEISRPARPGEVWKPSLMGRMMIKSFQSPRPLTAPRMYRDVRSPRPNVVQAFIEEQDSLERLLEKADRVSWRRTRTRSPVTGLVRLNLGDCFALLVAHTERHLGQIDRVTNRTGFPSNAPSDP